MMDCTAFAVLRRLTTGTALAAWAVVVVTSELIPSFLVLVAVLMALFVPLLVPALLAVSLFLLLSHVCSTLVAPLVVRPDSFPVAAGPPFLTSIVCGSTGLILCWHLITLLRRALSFTSSGVK